MKNTVQKNVRAPGLMFRCLPVVLMIFCDMSFAKEIDANSMKEINHLFSFINSSSCKFNRNGEWHKSSDAGDHIKTKFDYLRDKGKIGSTEDFIDLAATKSSMSGKYYWVECGDAAQIKSADWLRSEIASFRSKRP